MGSPPAEEIDAGRRNRLRGAMSLRDNPDFDGCRQAGESFERFIGAHYTARGWEVWYRDQDRQGGGLGIDIVATKAERQVLLQCKRWATAREITADIVEQLARDACRYIARRAAEDQHLMEFFKPRAYVVVLATTTALDAAAKARATRHGIIVKERVEYPPEQHVNFATAATDAATPAENAPTETTPPHAEPFQIATKPPFTIPRKAWWRRLLRL